MLFVCLLIRLNTFEKSLLLFYTVAAKEYEKEKKTCNFWRQNEVRKQIIEKENTLPKKQRNKVSNNCSSSCSKWEEK